MLLGALLILDRFSGLVNDCGKWLNNVGNGQRYEGTYRVPGTGERPFRAIGQCEEWTDYTQYDQARKDGLRMVYSGHVDAFRVSTSLHCRAAGHHKRKAFEN